MILTLELEPGAHTSEAQLCELLDCGRTPLREALQRLTEQSLVKHTPGRGYSIAPLDVFDFVDAMDAMSLMAGITASLAVERLSDQDLSDLEEVLFRAEKLATEADFTSVSQYDMEFHVRIVNAVGNRQLVRFLTHNARRVGRDPLKMLHQLGRFDRQRHTQVLRRMKLLPVAGVDELAD